MTMSYDEISAMLAMQVANRPWIEACKFLLAQIATLEHEAADKCEAERKKARANPKTDSRKKEIDSLKSTIVELKQQLRSSETEKNSITNKIWAALVEQLGPECRKQALEQNVRSVCNRMKLAEATLPAESELQKEVRALRAVVDVSDNARSLKEQLRGIDDLCEKHGFSIHFDRYDRQIASVMSAYMREKKRADDLQEAAAKGTKE